MPSFQPIISVTLPNYNHGRFLEEALVSVLTQSYENLEILFVDDGSNDESRQIAEKYAAQDERLKPVYFDKNQGALAAHANSWSRVKGDIIYQYSSDDSIHDPDFFQLGVDALKAYPEASGFYGEAALIDADDGHFLGKMGNTSPAGFIKPSDFLRGFLSLGYFVPGISSLWRYKSIMNSGGYDYRLGPQTDYFINHALPCQSGVVCMRRHFANARVSRSKSSYSSNRTLNDELQSFSLFACKLRFITSHLDSSDANWDDWRKRISKELMDKHKYSAPRA